MKRDNPMPTRMWLGIATFGAVAVLAYTFVAGKKPLAQAGELDPNLGVEDEKALSELVLREQKNHPATPEMKEAANSLEGKPAPAFDLLGIKGERHTQASLTTGKPLLIFFVEKECPCCLGAKYYVERIDEMYEGKMNTVAIINADKKVAEAWAHVTKANFDVLMDPAQKVIRAYGAERGVYTTLVGPGGKIEKAYAGYSLDMLKDLSSRIAKLANIPEPKFAMSKAPTTLTSGCTFPEPDPSTTNP